MTPKVRLIASTHPDMHAIRQFLDSEDVEEWEPQESGEGLVELAGKLCYRSYEPGLNPNVRRCRQHPRDYLANILKSGHGSVLEHVTGTFIFTGVSRVFSHELCRHRVGTAISEQSLRYVRPTELEFYQPEALDEEISCRFNRGMRAGWEAFRELEGSTNVQELESFGERKRATSAIRRVLPMGIATKLVWTANIRTLRHVIRLRTSRHAEEEMRAVFGKVAEICQDTWPLLFQDAISKPVGHFDEWHFLYPA